MGKGLGETQKKILLLLQGGIALGLSGSPKRYFQILKEIDREWGDINRNSFKRSIKSLYASKLIGERENKDGTVTLFLTNEGKKKAITCDINNLKLKKPLKWDGYWRIVIYDIPETYRGARDLLRIHLKDIGFIELQHSVWIYPHDCLDRIEFLSSFYGLGKHVRIIVADFVDNEDYLKRRFDLVNQTNK